MPSTSGFALPYPALSDPPNGPGGLQALAEAVDPLLARATVCTSATRPGSPASGRLIYETDTGLILLYSGSWRVVGSSDAVSTEYRSYATSAQTLGNGANVNVAFGVDAVTTSLVTKATNGAGHQFTLNRAGRWALSATVRFAAASAGETYVSLVVGTTLMTADGGGTDGRVTTRNLNMIRRFTSGSVITVGAYQATGASLNTGPEAGGGWVNFCAVWLGP